MAHIAGVPGTGKPPTPLQKAFGDRVRQRRVELGLSQERLAESAGIDRSYIGSVEGGRRNISLNNLARLARALDLDCADLVEGLQELPGR
jgi:transcriptional regulator with XRE-family HTH domain